MGGCSSIDASVTGSQREAEEIASHCIGPIFDGSIYMAQACDLLGITSNGEKPKVPTREELLSYSPVHAGARDFSGMTTYWIGDFMLTRKSVEALIVELSATMPPITLLDTKYDRQARKVYLQERSRLLDCENSALVGIGGDRVGDPETNRASIQRWRSRANLEHVIRIALPWKGIGKRATCKRAGPFETQVMQSLGRRIYVCPKGFSQISTSFETGDPFGDKFVSAIARCFTSEVEHIDLATNRALKPMNDSVVWHGNNMVRWCRARPDRYLGGHCDKTGDATLEPTGPSLRSDRRLVRRARALAQLNKGGAPHGDRRAAHGEKISEMTSVRDVDPAPGLRSAGLGRFCGAPSARRRSAASRSGPCDPRAPRRRGRRDRRGRRKCAGCPRSRPSR